jgi:hypothetical protein
VSYSTLARSFLPRVSLATPCHPCRNSTACYAVLIIRPDDLNPWTQCLNNMPVASHIHGKKTVAATVFSPFMTVFDTVFCPFLIRFFRAIFVALRENSTR